MNRNKNKVVILLSFFLSVFSLSAIAQFDLPEVHPDVKALLNSTEVPEGIVFDIETLNENALTELAPYVKKQIKRLKKAFPDADIAVVTHGTEEFALQKQAAEQNSELHNMFNQLVVDSGVSVHVCGAVGGLKQLTQDDFPEFVSYSESGLAQLNDYKALDYKVIRINQLNDAQRKDLFEHTEKYLKLDK